MCLIFIQRCLGVYFMWSFCHQMSHKAIFFQLSSRSRFKKNAAKKGNFNGKMQILKLNSEKKNK